MNKCFDLGEQGRWDVDDRDEVHSVLWERGRIVDRPIGRSQPNRSCYPFPDQVRKM
jgi:hypothetical protein